MARSDKRWLLLYSSSSWINNLLAVYLEKVARKMNKLRPKWDLIKQLCSFFLRGHHSLDFSLSDPRGEKKRSDRKTHKRRRLKQSGMCFFVQPWRLTWNIVMEVWKIIFLSKWVIRRFHVNLPGCIFFSNSKNAKEGHKMVSSWWPGPRWRCWRVCFPVRWLFFFFGGWNQSGNLSHRDDIYFLLQLRCQQEKYFQIFTWNRLKGLFFWMTKWSTHYINI